MIKNLQEQKKEVVYIQAAPDKLKQSDLAVFEQKCQYVNQMCDTLGLITKNDASILTDPVQFAELGMMQQKAAPM